MALLCMLSLGPNAIAGPPDHRWRTFNQLDGFNASQVFDIAQTPDGALWFATDAGVFRFDGVWQQMNSGLPAALTFTLLIDGDGRLWAGGLGGVSLWNDDAWVLQGKGTELAGQRINDMILLSDGSILAGGATGMYLWGPTNGWQRLADAPLPGADHLIQDALQRVWVAQGTQLFSHTDTGWVEVYLAPQQLKGFEITDLIADADGGVWVATQDRGIAHLQDAAVVWETTAGGLPEDHVLDLTMGADGSLWAGTTGGAGRLGIHGWDAFGVEDGLASEIISVVFQDRDGIFWFGSPAGISRYNAHTWHRWDPASGAPQGAIAALTMAPDGVLWAAEVGGGLYRWQDDAWRNIEIVGDEITSSPNFITSLMADETGGIWMSSQDEGVIYYHDPLARRLLPADGSADQMVTSMAKTPDGKLWFGTKSAGLMQWDRRTWRTFTMQDGLISNVITALLVDRDGALLVGTDVGLARYDGDVWQSLGFPEGFASGEISALAQGEDGAIWASFRDIGLGVFYEDDWRTIGDDSGVSTTRVNALLQQGGRLWVGTQAGLSVYDGFTWQHYYPAYGYHIGPVYTLVGDGQDAVYLGDDAGVMRYESDLVAPTLDLRAINGKKPQGDGVDVHAGENVQISLHSNDTVSLPDELIYLYRLRGVDDAWRMTRRTTIEYPSLDAGDYLFTALVRDADMNYSQPLTLTLHAARPTAFVLFPGLTERMCPWLAVLSIVLLGLFLAVVGYALWSTVVRWHMRNQAVERRFNPYIAGVPVRSPDMFFGRDELLRNAEAGLAHNSLMIYGERRIGKTSLLYRLLDDLRQMKDDRFKFFPVFVDLEGTLESEFFHHLMEGLLDALQHELEDFPAQQKLQFYAASDDVGYTDRHMRRDLRQIVSHLKKNHEKTPRIIFLLDEADVLSTYSSLTQQQLRRILQDVFAQNVGVVIAGVHISKAWDRVESPWYNMFVEVVVSPLNRYESELLMREPVYGFYEWEENAVRFVWQRTQGRPHRIQKIAREAVNVMLDDHRQTITLADVRRAYERVVFAERH